MITFLLYLIWIAYSIVSGHFEAKYWYLRNYAHNPLKFKSEHETLTLLRIALAVTITGHFYDMYGWMSLCGLGAMILMFPFFHDGAYYHFRNKLDGSYPEGWMATSTTSTAVFTLEYPLRVIFLVHTVILIALMVS